MSTVIKAGEAAKLVSRLTTVDLADHLGEARAVVDGAKRHASNLIRQAEARVEQVLADAKRQGYQDGHQRGYAEGLATGRDDAYRDATERFNQQHQQLVDSLSNIIDAVDAQKRDVAIAAEQDVLAFAIQLATKLTFRIGACHGASAAANLERAIELIGTKQDLTAHISPDDHEAMKTFAADLTDRLGTSTRVNLVADESIDPGGCTVCNDISHVDATLRTQIDEIVALLLGHASPLEGDGERAL